MAAIVVFWLKTPHPGPRRDTPPHNLATAMVESVDRASVPLKYQRSGYLRAEAGASLRNRTKLAFAGNAGMAGRVVTFVMSTSYYDAFRLGKTTLQVHYSADMAGPAR